jgi:L-aminopeptidase/D-esterase-like protein
LSTGTGAVAAPDQLARLGAAAACCLARAIMRAVIEAEPLGGFINWRQRWGSAAV